jgi:hypothetical protein
MYMYTHMYTYLYTHTHIYTHKTLHIRTCTCIYISKHTAPYIMCVQTIPTYLQTAQESQFGFSRNVICLDIKGPNVPNLTLIDLPGIIRSTEKAEEKVNVRLVRSLVIDYIKRPNAIIVATVSLKQEMENTVIRALAREADPTGSRTVGVLTKPDRLERGAHQQKIDVLTGKLYRLEHG